MKIKTSKEAHRQNVEVTIVFTPLEYAQIKVCADKDYGRSPEEWIALCIEQHMECMIGDG